MSLDDQSVPNWDSLNLNQKGQLICEDLEAQGHNFEYRVSSDGHLLLLRGRAILGHVEDAPDGMHYWKDIYVNFKSIHQRELGANIRFDTPLIRDRIENKIDLS